MDKITRLLMLYSKLINGEKVNKLMFCLETDCLPRTFDRDIEDIRLYLSESFTFDELIYDRKENSYYLSNMQRQPLEKTEYLILEQLLLDTGILCTEETDGLLTHLVHNTHQSKTINEHKNHRLLLYNSASVTPLLKMYGDLKNVIEQKRVIELKCTKNDNICESIPIAIKYHNSELLLFTLSTEKFEEHVYRVSEIVSFVIKRKQYQSEILKSEKYIEKIMEAYYGKTY